MIGGARQIYQLLRSESIVLSRSGRRIRRNQSTEVFKLSPNKIRNVAIIAHVDHGKTTLVDKILRVQDTWKPSESKERLMDSNALEQERGITILAKCTNIQWNGYHMNVVDTPGHG